MALIARGLIFFIGLLPESLVAQSIYYTSPNGVVEECRNIADIPGGSYSENMKKEAGRLCSYDFYAADVGWCPKTFSTSPGTIIYSIPPGTSKEDWQAVNCHKKPMPVATFKQSMNQKNTSGTFSQAPLLYYHFSRYFNSYIRVPVAVHRTIDREAHYQQVTRKVRGLSGMIAAGWAHVADAETRPDSAPAASELLTPDKKQVFGTLLRWEGERYGPEINGTRASGWGNGQNYDFQKTPAFLALKSEESFEAAYLNAQTLARRDAIMRKAMGPDVINAVQMVYWMQELIEITLLDYIFTQQDRVGNIDYTWAATWVDAQGTIFHQKLPSKAPRSSVTSVTVPEDLFPFNPFVLQRTHLNDNDAGGKLQYANFTKRTKMLEGLRHYNAETYRKLIFLAEDFRNQGPLHAYLITNFILDNQQINQIVKNTYEAAGILQTHCTEGLLRFDIDPNDFLRSGGTAREVTVDCQHPT